MNSFRIDDCIPAFHAAVTAWDPKNLVDILGEKPEYLVIPKFNLPTANADLLIIQALHFKLSFYTAGSFSIPPKPLCSTNHFL